MPLLDEVAAIEAADAEKNRQEAIDRRERSIAAAAEQFRKAFGEDPESVTAIHREYDIGGGIYRVSTCYASALIEHEGVRLIRTHGQHEELRALVTCEECGRDFASHETVYGYGDTPEDRRRRALESLTRALTKHQGRHSDLYAHKCEQTVMRGVRSAIRDAAATLKVSEWTIIEKAREEVQ